MHFSYLRDHLSYHITHGNIKASLLLGKWDNIIYAPAVIVKFIYLGQKKEISWRMMWLSTALNPNNESGIYIRKVYNPNNVILCVPNDLGNSRKAWHSLVIKTTAKNLRVTLSQKHLTRSRNQIWATKSLEYMFHYINWRPTSVIKKHSLPSETEFFFNKEGDTTPQDKETVPRSTWPPVTTKTNLTTPSVRASEEEAAASRKAPKRLHQEKPPQDDFLVSDVTKDEEIFFQGFQTSPDQEGLTFFGCRRHQEMIARGPRRHLRSPFPG